MENLFIAGNDSPHNRSVTAPPMKIPPKKPMAKIVLVFINIRFPLCEEPSLRNYVHGVRSHSQLRELFVLAIPRKAMNMSPSGSSLILNEKRSLPYHLSVATHQEKALIETSKPPVKQAVCAARCRKLAGTPPIAVDYSDAVPQGNQDDV